MKEIVRLKGYPNGIQIVIDEEASFEDILNEISEKFKDSEKFFGKAKKSISFEGRKNTPQEEQQILDAIQKACDLSIVCVLTKEVDLQYKDAVRVVENTTSEPLAQFYKGSLSTRKVLETDRSIVILGDVQSGAMVVSKKNIIVLGTLSGSAYAGVDGKPHFIVALHMDPEQIKISDVKGKYKKKKGFLAKKDQGPQIAYRKDDSIVFENLENTEELLGDLV